MTRYAKIRSTLFAAITLLGSVYLSVPARAAVAEGKSSCDDYAAGYAAGVCAAIGSTPASYSYVCGSNGRPIKIDVICN
ncbi:MAG TPA: hypothetical protein VFJ16_30715 [Longimicrobium sp.]|nr:hypothetical protein [Longimicrobium sp.]